jgi:RNA polymerase sigma-70 factor, ECF subfamily
VDEDSVVVLLKEARERSDAGLVDGCRGGDSSAFDELVHRYKDRVYNVIYRFVGNHEDALDVSQEVFVRAYRGISEFRGTAQVYTWLYSIAANLARNRLRDSGRKGRDKGVSLEQITDESRVSTAAGRDPRGEAERREMDEVLQRCLTELPEHYRLAFVLRTFDSLSYEEIAESLGCPVGTVKSRINQARTLLRGRLHELEVL